MDKLSAPLLDVEKIDVEEGFNVRTHMDEEGLEQLAANLGRAGVVQPITVKPAEDGRYTLIAGHRRFRAAQIAGVEKIPAVLGDEASARRANLVENLHREELDPIDTARGLKALKEEFNLSTNQQLAEEVSKTPEWVSQHLRLLSLPEGAQRQIADRAVPVEAERLLRKVAKVSPRVAECVCELARRRKVKPSQFVGAFGELLAETAEARFEERPTMLDPGAVPLRLLADAEQREKLAERFRAMGPHHPDADPTIKLGEAEIDAARAAGCLVEHRVDHGGWVSTVSFITDTELAGDLIARAVERFEAEEAEREEREEQWRAAQAKHRGEADPQADRRAQHAEREERKAQARRANEELGRKMLQRRGGASRKEHALARAKALSAIVLADNPKLAARGLRLVTSQLQEVEVKQLKASGKTREKVSYADPEQCREYLEGRIEGARSVGEVLELIGDAVIASLLADEDELPQSRRAYAQIAAAEPVSKLLAADMKSVRPSRRRSKVRS